MYRHIENLMTQCRLAWLPAAALALAFSGQAPAQTGECGAEREVTQSLMDERTYRRMERAYELVGDEDYDEAYDVFVQVRNSANNDYLRAVAAQAIAQVEWARGNYDAALREFELAVELNALPDQAHYTLMYQIAQLYYMKDRYDEALAALDLWFCRVPADQHKDTAYVLKASIHAQKEDWPEVVAAVDQAIAMSDDPKEDWYRLKLAAVFEMDDYPAAAETLQTMIARWPDKKTYWTQLSNTWSQLGRDDEALSVSALAWRRNMLDTQNDLLHLASLYSLREVPYKAAQVMQKGIEDGIVEPTERHWTLVGDSWYAAEEYDNALVAFERAGQAALDGSIDLRRAYILVDMERWEEAGEALGAALEKGGLDDNRTGEAYLMLGMSAFNLGDFDRASANWGRAGRYERTRNAAQQWMAHLREERARRSAGL